GAKKQENLRATQPLLELGRTLVKLSTDVPLKLDWEGWKYRPIQSAEALKLFQEWGFQGLARQVRDGVPSGHPTLFGEGAEAFPFGANAPANGTHKPESKWTAIYRLVDTPEEFDRFFGLLNVQKRFAVDLETTGLEPLRCEIVGLAFCWKEGEAHYLAPRAPAGEKHLDPQILLPHLKPTPPQPA